MFCPYCANLLRVQRGDLGMRFACKVKNTVHPPKWDLRGWSCIRFHHLICLVFFCFGAHTLGWPCIERLLEHYFSLKHMRPSGSADLPLQLQSRQDIEEGSSSGTEEGMMVRLGFRHIVCVLCSWLRHVPQVDDVLGDTFKNAPVTDVLGGCPKCGAWDILYAFFLSCMVFGFGSTFYADSVRVKHCACLAGCHKAYYFEMQIRSADEPATRYVHCPVSSLRLKHAGSCSLHMARVQVLHVRSSKQWMWSQMEGRLISWNG